MTTSLSILGSTGVIGTHTLDVIDHLGGFEIVALTAGKNVSRLAEQMERYRPRFVSVQDDLARRELQSLLIGKAIDVEIGVGQEGLLEAARLSSDMVVTAVVGSVGILPTWEAIQRGATVALANKETLVAAGEFIMPLADAKGVTILPLDSEHSAIFQCLQGYTKESVARFLVTASGGPFRTYTNEKLQTVKREDALRHPTWAMGAKITIDSATLMNKGLEVIEAHHLFRAPYDSIEVVVHPQSIIHSMVEFVDGSTLAQLGPPDMRVPIQYALTYPNRRRRPSRQLHFAELKELTFENPDVERFPCLRLAFEAGRSGGYAPCVLNAANEIAVEAFLAEQIPFTTIPRIVEATLVRCVNGAPSALEDVLDMDMHARRIAMEILREGR